MAFETAGGEESTTAKMRRPLSRVAVLARIEFCFPRLRGGGQGAFSFDAFRYGEVNNKCEKWYRREYVLTGQMGAWETAVRNGRAVAESGFLRSKDQSCKLMRARVFPTTLCSIQCYRAARCEWEELMM